MTRVTASAHTWIVKETRGEIMKLAYPPVETSPDKTDGHGNPLIWGTIPPRTIELTSDYTGKPITIFVHQIVALEVA